jgi:hypothetical protein
MNTGGYAVIMFVERIAKLQLIKFIVYYQTRSNIHVENKSVSFLKTVGSCLVRLVPDGRNAGPIRDRKRFPAIHRTFGQSAANGLLTADRKASKI